MSLIPQKLRKNIAKEERLASYDNSDKVISSYDFHKKLKEEKGKEVFIFKSELPRLDKLTEGFESGELVIVSGYTGHGKTSLCQSLTMNFAHQKIKVLWFSYEMTARQFFSKFQDLPLFYLPMELKGSAIDWLEERILEAKIKFDIRIVMIDHLHFLLDLARANHPSIEIGNVMRELKLMALRHNIVIFLVAHTSMPKGNKAPDLNIIRDSSFITQESDSVMVIQRNKKKGTGVYSNESYLTILKHRRMGTMGAKVKLLYKDKQFYETFGND